MSDPTEASGLTPDELARMEANAAAAQVTAEWRDLMVGHIRRLAVAYRELSAHAAVQVSTRTDRIADLEGALRAAIEQRDSARARLEHARRGRREARQQVRELEAERDGLANRVRELEATVSRVRDIHPRETQQDEQVCGRCLDAYEGFMAWPCPTMAALDGLDGSGPGE